MNNINYEDTLVEFYNSANDISNISLPANIATDTNYILDRINKNKGVYTVLITLALYKTINPKQDIRQHKIELKNGFSGRTFDTKFVTPTLKRLGLPAMAESGWLTRSLEQAYAYDMKYKGKISPEKLKIAFLNIVAYIQQGEKQAKEILLTLLNGGIKFKKENQIDIKKIKNDDIQISAIINILKQHFEENYHTHGGSKLPVIAFYAIYSILVNELSRFKNCYLGNLSSHTASDKTSQSGGDIEVFDENNNIFEALEIKLNKPPTSHMVRIAYDKINNFGIKRYYILSGLTANENELKDIFELINTIQSTHGCQIIVNGLYFSLKYYLRLISSPNLFINKYIELVTNDNELQKVHKEKLHMLLTEIL